MFASSAAVYGPRALYAGPTVREDDPLAPPNRYGVWKLAAELKVTAFVNKWGSAVRDDHLPLNRAGIPTIDIIDFDYRHWHKLSDVPANCSGESMEQVARVVVVWMQRAK